MNKTISLILYIFLCHTSPTFCMDRQNGIKHSLIQIRPQKITQETPSHLHWLSKLYDRLPSDTTINKSTAALAYFAQQFGTGLGLSMSVNNIAATLTGPSSCYSWQNDMLNRQETVNVMKGYFFNSFGQVLIAGYNLASLTTMPPHHKERLAPLIAFELATIQCEVSPEYNFSNFYRNEPDPFIENTVLATTLASCLLAATPTILARMKSTTFVKKLIEKIYPKEYHLMGETVEVTDDTECGICRESFMDLSTKAILSCNHYFCAPCLSKFLHPNPTDDDEDDNDSGYENPQKECPYCRKPIDKNIYPLEELLKFCKSPMQS